jgi:hypothetical protein
MGAPSGTRSFSRGSRTDVQELRARSTLAGECLSCTTVATRRSLDTVKAVGIPSLQNRAQVSVSGALVKRRTLQLLFQLSPHKSASDTAKPTPLRGERGVGAASSLVAELATATRSLTVLRCDERGLTAGLKRRRHLRGPRLTASGRSHHLDQRRVPVLSLQFPRQLDTLAEQNTLSAAGANKV